ncbi:hypothetical protein LSAT2_004252 [Lamellibrachia satsuma]|nr:hypothetical protein LSAT2_004252 [Lamellibrachia satsuma]
MESYSHALVHFKEDNAIEIVKIRNVITFNVETDSAKLDTDCLHEVRFDGEVYAARVMALGNSEEALIPRRTRAINYEPLSSPEPGAKRMRKLKRPYSPTQQSDDNSEGETTAKKDLSVQIDLDTDSSDEEEYIPRHVLLSQIFSLKQKLKKETAEKQALVQTLATLTELPNFITEMKRLTAPTTHKLSKDQVPGTCKGPVVRSSPECAPSVSGVSKNMVMKTTRPPTDRPREPENIVDNMFGNNSQLLAKEQGKGFEVMFNTLCRTKLSNVKKQMRKDV